MNLRDLILRMRALAVPRRVERELDEELAFHIEREAQKHIADGVSPAEALTRARTRFGSLSLAADQCRDARGTAIVDGLARDILYAFRSFRRAPLTALTIIATVGLGLGLITVVFTVYNNFFLQADAVRNPGELFELRTAPSPDARIWLSFTRPRYEALRRDTSVLTDAVAMVRDVRTRIDGRPLRSTLVTGNFFQVLGVDAALGRTLFPADDNPSGGRPMIVLSHRGWHRLFADDPTVIGQDVRINGMPYTIVGIMPEDFRGLGIVPPDYWAPLALAEELRKALPAFYADRGSEIFVEVVGRLKPGMSPAAATAGLSVWASGRPDLTTRNGRFTHVQLLPSDGTLSSDGVLAFAPIFFAFGLVLMIGCANVANLLLARGVARQREIGIRLSLGASRRRILRQLLTESLLLALAAAACGFLVSRLFLEGALYAATTATPPELAEQLTVVSPAADWRVLVFLVAGAVVSTVVFGLVPALHVTRLELVRTMRGEVVKDARPGRARYALIAAQVGASAILLICAAVFLRSALAAAIAGPGLRASDTVTVPISNEARRAALLQEVMAHPSVAMVAASAPDVTGRFNITRVDAVAETPAEPSNRSTVQYQFVSPEYFSVLGIDVVRGRGFTAAERTPDAGVVIVSEQTARRLWPNRDAVGRVVRFQASQPPEAQRSDAERPQPRAYTVIGVVRDVEAHLGILTLDGAGVYVPIGPENPGTSLTLRVRGDPDQARLALLEHLPDIDPALGPIRTIRAIVGLQAFVLRSAFWVTVTLGVLALALTLSGLFSVLSYVVEQRAKEIGVRMALGATTNNVAGLVLSESLRPVGLGLLAGGSLAAALAIVLMATSAASQVGVVHVLDPVAYGASLLVIVTACVLAALVPAMRAARIDPIATLRKD